ncbi:hypothetical protein M569_15208, partial [Genlisea aurea]
AMAPDNLIHSPHRRTQSQTAFSSVPSKKQFPRSDEVGNNNFSSLVKRHRFLLVALAVLTCLCTIYLYFAVTLGAGDSCSGLADAEKVTCRLQLSKAAMAKGKLKLF